MQVTFEYNASTDLARIRFGPPLVGNMEMVSLAEVDCDGEVYATAVESITLGFSHDGRLLALEVRSATQVLSPALIASVKAYSKGQLQAASGVRLTYSSSSNSAYIFLAPGEVRKNLESLNLAEVESEGNEVYADAGPWVTLDFTSDGLLAGIDVLLASHFLPVDLLADAESA